jgi:hypothetical protein
MPLKHMGLEIYIISFLTSVVDGSRWSSSAYAVLLAGISPRYPLNGQLVNPRVGLELKNRKLIFPFPGI